MWQPSVVTGADLSIEGCIHQFGHEIAYFHRLERQQLWFASRHRDWLTKIVFYTTRQSRLRSMTPTPRKPSSTYVTFKSPRRSTECQFPPIGKYSTLQYKAVKVTIDTPDFAEVISDVVICHHDLLDSAIAMEALSGIVVCHHDLLDSVVTNSNALYPLGTCHYCAMFYALDAVLLSCPICKLAALPKGRIATSKAYLWVFVSSEPLSVLSVCQLQTRWVA